MRARLGVNIDHVATLRQARGTAYPEPLLAAQLAELAGADQITVHLREDRRHIQDRDVRLLRQVVQRPLNLEMACTAEMQAIACELLPNVVTLVPERRQERTTEGGLDCLGMGDEIGGLIAALTAHGVEVSLFIAPDAAQIRAAAQLGAHTVELHTGEFAHAFGTASEASHLAALASGAELAASLGLSVAAGHGLDLRNVAPLLEIDAIEEFNIGHSLVARAIFVGFETAVREMLAALGPGAPTTPSPHAASMNGVPAGPERIASAAEIAELDRSTIDDFGLAAPVLMERAALACVARIEREFARPSTAAVLAGPGNNGADGCAVARLLAQAGWQVSLVQPVPPRPDTVAGLQRRLAERAGAIPTTDATAALRAATLWVDALLGVGPPPRAEGPVAELITHAEQLRQRVPIAPWVLAVDLPSGVDTNTGVAQHGAIAANATVTFGALKWGLLLPPGCDLAGAVSVADIGFDRAGLTRLASARHSLGSLWPALPAWAQSAHKGSRGRVLIVAGSLAMPGAAVLAAGGALAAGAGLVGLCAPSEVRALVQARYPEVVGVTPEAVAPFAAAARAVLVGPGLGTDPAAADLATAALGATSGRCVLDADALNLLAASQLQTPAGSVLTPHPLELARLLEQPLAVVLNDLVGAASAAAARFDGTIVAKTSGAVVARPRQAPQFAGGPNPSLGTAGSGDVLGGLLAGLLAQGAGDLAPELAVALHAAAGAVAAQTVGARSVTALSLVAALGTVLAGTERAPRERQ